MEILLNMRLTTSTFTDDTSLDAAINIVFHYTKQNTFGAEKEPHQKDQDSYYPINLGRFSLLAGTLS